MTVLNDEISRTVREPPRINSERGMYGKFPTLYEDLDGGSDPIDLFSDNTCKEGSVLGPGSRQNLRNNRMSTKAFEVRSGQL